MPFQSGLYNQFVRIVSGPLIIAFALSVFRSLSVYLCSCFVIRCHQFGSQNFSHLNRYCAKWINWTNFSNFDLAKVFRQVIMCCLGKHCHRVSSIAPLLPYAKVKIFFADRSTFKLHHLQSRMMFFMAHFMQNK